MFKRNLKIGFIKGGQLAKMMLQVAPGFDVQSHCLDRDPQAPARHLCHQFTMGDERSFDDVYQFGKTVELLTFEYEHVHVGAIKQLQKEGLAVYPSPEILELVQDKGRQKEFFRRQRIPTSDFFLVDRKSDLAQHADFFPAVQKTRTAGYDGKGVYKIRSQADVAHALEGACVLEKWVDFHKEISVVLARNHHGETAVYPTVEMMFHPQKNLVEFLSSPANITTGVERKARRIALTIAAKLDMVGVLAVEMFVTKKGEVLVNEIAPRVHNSGHHTIEANRTSQFEQHLRAIMGLPLGATDATAAAVMVNILGHPDAQGPARYEGVEKALALGGVYIHLYGKALTQPFRKMGHATVIAKTVSLALKKAKRVQQLIRVKA